MSGANWGVFGVEEFDSPSAFSALFCFLRLFLSFRLFSFVPVADGAKGDAAATDGGFPRFGLSGLDLAGLYRSWKFKTALGRAPNGEGAEGAGEGVEGISEEALRLRFCSAFLEDGLSIDSAVVEFGEEAEPTCGGILEGFGDLDCFGLGFDFELDD